MAFEFLEKASVFIMEASANMGITVVMPAFNAEKTIVRAMESVLNQTFTNLELLVVDDCSTDATADLILTYRNQDPRVRMIRNSQNMGVSASRNNGVLNARYPWIAFLDSDDFWKKEKLDAQIRVLEAHPEAALCFTATAFVDELGTMSEYILRARPRVTYDELLTQNVMSCSSVLVRRKDLLENPMHSNPMIHEDYGVWLMLLKKYPYAVGLDEPMLVYQISASSKSGNKVRAAKMQWNTYRHCKVPIPRASLCFVSYAAKNLRKYFEIKRRMRAS